jgi:large subunit ribosomal protein L10
VNTVNKKQRQESVASLSEKISVSTAGFLVDFQGLNVEASNKLRKQIRTAGSELKVTKNTLLRIASQNTNFALLNESFSGPTGVVFIKDNPVPVIKIITKFIKDNPTLPVKIKGGLLNKKLLSAQEIDALANLPSREVLLGQLVGLLAAPARGLVSVLAEIPRKFLRVLSAIADAKQKP